MSALPTFMRVKSAREGLISDYGRLPANWQGENADSVHVDHVDFGVDGPAITLTIGFAATNPARFVSLVLGDYLHLEDGDVAVLRLDAEVSRVRSVAAAYLVVREWIAGGTYVGQATRPMAVAGGLAPAVAARMATGDSRLFQPLLSVQRADGGEGQATVRLRRVAFAGLHDHPAWLAA